MKKILILSTLLFAVLLTLTACSKAPVNREIQNPENSKQGAGSPRSRMPDFGQPDRPADIRGVVKSITGNEATILKVEMKGGRGNENASSTPDSDNASNTRQAPSVSLSGAGGQGRDWAGGGAGRPGMPGGNGTVDRAAMLARLKAMSTGEETVTIPVGIKMLKSDIDSNKKRTMVEASLSDIISDKSITIWLNQSVTDKKIAEFVLIN